MENFTPIASLVGGLLIGLAAVMLMALNGHIAGVTGVMRGVLQPKSGDVMWRVAFLLGLVAGPAIYQVFAGPVNSTLNTSSVPIIIAGGLLVGFGTTLGNGCTSGHGICGLGRISKRSLAATMAFMATAVLTVYVSRHIIGGG
ncbi:MAG: YeeE/YedE family protein [Rhodospirillales bacterium]|nr:YeeE/YedE family protein [Rhodospirillales bacterium]